MLNKYRLYQRANGVFYWQDQESSKQGSLKTKDREVAEKLLHSKNESHRQPSINLAIARTYLAAHDPKMGTRTWADVMDEMSTHGIESTRARCQRAMNSHEFDSLRQRPVVQTTAEELLNLLHKNSNSFAHYLRRLHAEASKRRKANSSDQNPLLFPLFSFQFFDSAGPDIRPFLVLGLADCSCRA